MSMMLVLCHSKAPFQGDRQGPPGINRRPSPSTSVGARAADVGLGGPLWSPASCSSGSNLGGTRSPIPTPRATIKALPTPHRPPSPLRDHRFPASVDAWKLRSLRQLPHLKPLGHTHIPHGG